MELNNLLSFIGATALLAFMPGPDNLFVLTESVTKGTKFGLTVSLGLVSGVMIHTLAAMTGISLILQNSVLAFSILKFLGAGYLFYLAYMASKESISTVKIEDQQIHSDYRFFKLFRKGFIMNVLNPKVSLFFLAFFPQFIKPSTLGVSGQILILGLVFMIVAFLVFSFISILSGQMKLYMENQGFWKKMKWVKVTVLAILGLSLVLSKN